MEILITLALFAIVAPVIVGGIVSSRSGEAVDRQRLLANGLIKLTQEAVRSVHTQGWAGISLNGIYHPAIASGTWNLLSGTDVVDGFSREVVISDVYRNAAGDIGTSGSLDPSTKKVIITVSWQDPSASSISSTAYYSRYLDNLIWRQSTFQDFDVGSTKTGVAVEYSNGSPTDGQIVLSGGGHGDWCQPDLTLATVDLPKNGVANALTAIPATAVSPGIVFAGTGDNASGVSFAKVHVTDSEPPTAAIPTPGTFDGYKTNGVFGENGYAYLATDNNGKEVEIINLSTNPFSEAGYFNAPGNGTANSVYVSGNVGYVAAGSSFYTFDLSSKSGSRGLLNGSHPLTLSGTGTRIIVIGTHAYVTTGSSGTPMQLIDVSDPTFPRIIAQVVSLNDRGATDLYVNQSETRAYIVTSLSSSAPEMFIVDISSKSGNMPVLSSRDLNGMSPKGIVAVTSNKVVAVGVGGTEYQVFNYDDTSHNITSCGTGLNIDSGINGIATVIQPSGSAFSYIITGDASSELKIIEGGPTGQSASSGTFVSAVYDAGFATAFNRLSYTASVPSGTALTFEIAIAAAVSGSCSAANFVYRPVNSDGSIPLEQSGTGYLNPGRCLRYKARLTTTDYSISPVLNEVIINYSP